MKRVLLFSHACVVEANRELFLQLERFYDMKIVCPAAWRGSLIQDLEAKESKAVWPRPVWFSGNGSLFFYRNRFADLKEFAPDLIFLDEEPWSLVALQVYAAFPRVPKVFYTKQNLFKKLPPPFSWIQNFVFRQSKGAFVISEEAREVLKWKHFNKQTFVLPHSLNEKNFSRLSDGEKTKRRQEFSLPADGFYLGYFGRISEEKGIRDLLEAAKRLWKESAPGEPLRLVICGNGALREEAEELARVFPQSLFVIPALPHGQVHRLMAAMSATVLPSRSTKRWKEQFGRVIIESAACGVPVIGSNSGEIPHLIARLGCGVFFPEGEVEALAKAIKRMWQLPADRTEAADRGEINALNDFAHAPVAGGLANRLADLGITPNTCS
jgi:glycosyltransferase involved in cell wall biosynthesis